MSEPVSYSSFALIDLLDAFASNEPVPGGGSAAALAGSLGVSLLVMVAGLPKTRTMAPEEAADLAEASSRLRPLREQLIDCDSDAYRKVMAALKRPKDTEADKAARREAIQAAMREATDVPMDVMRACQQALAGAVVIARNAYTLAASDVGMGVELLVASVRGCAMSIDGNLAGISDAAYSQRVSMERQQLEADSLADADKARSALRR